MRASLTGYGAGQMLAQCAAAAQKVVRHVTGSLVRQGEQQQLPDRDIGGW